MVVADPTPDLGPEPEPGGEARSEGEARSDGEVRSDGGPRVEGGGTVPHMDGETFRRLGHELVDWIADYHERVGTLPVASTVEPGWVRSQLPLHPPQSGEDLSALTDELDRIVVPGLTHWQHPSFFGFFPANTSYPSILGELISAGLGVQGMLWSTSPALTELESHVLDWLVELCALPDRFRSDGPGAFPVRVPCRPP